MYLGFLFFLFAHFPLVDIKFSLDSPIEHVTTLSLGAVAGAQSVGCFPGIQKALGSIPTIILTGCVGAHL